MCERIDHEFCRDTPTTKEVKCLLLDSWVFPVFLGGSSTEVRYLTESPGYISSNSSELGEMRLYDERNTF